MPKILIKNGQLGKDTEAYKKLHPSLNSVKVKVAYIILERAEGLIEECGKPVVVKSWKAADEVLRVWALTAPETGYDKVDFVAVFRNGETYQGTYDLYRNLAKFEGLAHHVTCFLNAYSSLDRCRKILNGYKIGE